MDDTCGARGVPQLGGDVERASEVFGRRPRRPQLLGLVLGEVTSERSHAITVSGRRQLEVLMGRRLVGRRAALVERIDQLADLGVGGSQHLLQVIGRTRAAAPAQQSWKRVVQDLAVRGRAGDVGMVCLHAGLHRAAAGLIPAPTARINHPLALTWRASLRSATVPSSSGWPLAVCSKCAHGVGQRGVVGLAPACSREASIRTVGMVGMQAQPFNGPPMHVVANTFLAAMVRREVARYFAFDTSQPQDTDQLARVAIVFCGKNISEDMLALFNELGRSCSPPVAADLLDALERELNWRELGDSDGFTRLAWAA
jgi:hypothetical protein